MKFSKTNIFYSNLTEQTLKYKLANYLEQQKNYEVVVTAERNSTVFKRFQFEMYDTLFVR